MIKIISKLQDSKFRKAFGNSFSVNIKLSKTQLHNTGQSEGFLGRLLGPFLESGLPLVINVLKLQAKSVLEPLGLTTAVSSTDTAIHKKISGSGIPTLIISNVEMNDIIKINSHLKNLIDW